MRICTITTSYPRDEDDFAGRFVADLNLGLSELGHQVLTLAPEAPGFPREERDRSGLVRRIAYTQSADQADLFYGHGVERNVRRISKPWGKVRQWQRAVTTQLKKDAEQIDLVVAHWLWPSLVTARQWKRATGRPLLGIGHGGDLHLLSRPLLGRYLSRGIKGLADGLICTHDQGAATALARGLITSDKLKVSAMGTDPQRFEQARRLPSTPGTPSQFILAVGRLDPIKGFDLLIKALAQCKGPKLPLILLGDGPERTALTNLAEGLGVQVYFRGTQSPKQVAHAMTQASLLVIPSRTGPKGRTEGTPVTAIEGLVAGTPILASATGGLPNLLPKHCLFPVKQVPHLSTLIDQAIATDGESARVDPTPPGLSCIETAQALLSLASY